MKAILIAALAVILYGCAGSMPKQEPVVVGVPAPSIVQVKCADGRGPHPDFPDTDDKLAGIHANDYEALAKAYRAGRDMRIDWEAKSEVQVKACVGE